MPSPIDLLLINPPLTQLNTPYPGIAFLTGYLAKSGYQVRQADLGIGLINKLFTREGLCKVFDLGVKNPHPSPETKRVLALREVYESTIEGVIGYLAGRDSTLVYRIESRSLLPEGKRFASMQGSDEAFGSMGLRDRAQYYATLYIEELADFIKENVSSHFGFSRYAESIAVSASKFDPLEAELAKSPSLCEEIYLNELDELVRLHSPKVVGFSVPFPGNLFSSLAMGKYLKENYPDIKVVMGGGYPNTELRDLDEPRVFDYVDYITLDDGYRPLVQILEAARAGKLAPETGLKRTYLRREDKVEYVDTCKIPDISHRASGVPSYEGLLEYKYLQVIDLVNPMHRVWGHGRWNKLMFAHGCYWRRCTFCDTSLPYIAHYDMASASLLADRMDELYEATGETGFHGVDEAAPPAILRDLAIELLKRGRTYNYWTNIRFDKNFTYDLCRLLAHSGMIAVSGGIEVASERLLTLINKGVSLSQVARVARNFTSAGIMTHGYLMYGFPTQTEQETIDALEAVRQLFQEGLVLSGYWHRLSVTRHAPLGLRPEAFNIEIKTREKGRFANNDLAFFDPTGIDHAKFTDGLERALFNYMHGLSFDRPLASWFNFKIPRPSIAPDLIARYASESDELGSEVRLCWIGGRILTENAKPGKKSLAIHNKTEVFTLQVSEGEARCILDLVEKVGPQNSPLTLVSDFDASFKEALGFGIETWLSGKSGLKLREAGLLVL